MIRYFLALTLPLLALPCIAQDVAGSADHPLVGRFEGSTILYYESSDFDEADLLVARDPEERNPTVQTFEGAVTKIAYSVDVDGASELQVLRGFEQRLESQGFTLTFSCKNKDRDRENWCGSSQEPAGTWIESNSFPFQTLRVSFAEKSDETGQFWVQISVVRMRDGRVSYSVVMVENAAFENRVVDASLVENELTAQGKMAFYDILFETGSADLQADSAPTIAIIAEVLAANPEMKVVVVGHTDNQGTLEANIVLSQNRAASVANALRADHGVAEGRITHAGVGFLAPITTNASAEGRTLNRRVEIVVR